MSVDFDLAVVGSGFGGSLMAMIARRLGRTVVMVERGRHPRFVIGESSTPLANLLLEELARRYRLDRILPLTKWGTWQRTYPQIGCGLKRGFTFFHHRFGQAFSPDRNHENQLLVAASPSDPVADTHWYRPDFDHFLASEAQAADVEYLDRTNLTGLRIGQSDVQLEGDRLGRPVSIRARFLIDATGPRGFVHRALSLKEGTFEYLPQTQGLYTHFRDVERCESMGLVPPDESPPYRVDDAALHHVFDGGWIWVLRFNNGITSAGVAATESLANELRFAEGGPAWNRLLGRLPTVEAQFRRARIEFPFVHAPRLSFRSGAILGERWALLPHAAGFIDPLLSTGFSLTLLGIARLAAGLAEDWNTARWPARLEAYAQRTEQELLAAEQIVAALYSSMNNFPTFVALSLLYFASVSFSETARRLGHPELASSFLLHDQPFFGRRFRDCCQRARRMRSNARPRRENLKELRREILEAIQPIDVAGLSDASRRNWFPAKADDLLKAASKFGVEVSEMERLLERCGFYGKTRMGENSPMINRAWKA